jgi:hypothetical protein
MSLPLAATPAFTPAAGTYTGTQSIAIASATPNAAIYYTTNGATPTAGSTLYYGPITVSATESLKAVAIAYDYRPSTTASAVYTILPPAATPVFSPGPGTYIRGQKITLTDSTNGAAIDYTTNGTTPTTASSRYTAPIALTANTTVSALAVAPGYGHSPIATAAYTILPPTVATPVFNPPAGPYTTAQSVAITSATPGATIYYTTDNSAPTPSSTKYSSPIHVTATETLRALATAPTDTNSPIASAIYTFPTPAKITTIAGNGTPGFSGDGGPATAAQLNLNGGNTHSGTNSGLALDASGNIYILDADNCSIRVVSAADRSIVTLAGYGRCGAPFTGGFADGQPATSQQAGYLGGGLALDAAGNVYLSNTYSSLNCTTSEAPSTVRVVSASDGTISTVVGGCNPTILLDNGGYFLNTADTLTSISMQGLSSALALNYQSDPAGNLYFSTQNSSGYDNMLAEGSLTTGNLILKVAGPRTPAAAGDSCVTDPSAGPLTHFGTIAGIFTTGKGTVYFTDETNSALCSATTAVNQETLTLLAGYNFQSGYNGDNIPATTAWLNHPTGVVQDSQGNLYIADTDNHRIRMVSASNGLISTIAGTGVQGYSGDNGEPTAAQLSYPTGLAIDAGDNLYVLDSGNQVIRKITPAH